MAVRTAAEIFPPGEFIHDELEARGWSQMELAEILRRPPRLICELIAGKRAITPETAKGLGAAFGTGAEFWMNLERDYQLSRAVHDDRAVQRRARLHEKAPMKEMIKRGWLGAAAGIEEMERELLAFLELTDLEEEPRFAHAARRRTGRKLSPAEWAWVYRVKQIAKAMPSRSYSVERLLASIEKMESLLLAPEDAAQVPRLLSECGVRFVLVEKLPGSAVDGLCCWLDDKSPVIAMSLRRDKIDNFWFVLRHELEHVVRGDGKNGAMIDLELEGERTGTGPDLPREERAANAAASAFCVPEGKLKEFMTSRHPYYYERDVLAFARSVGRHPGLVVGQLQFRLNNYTYLTRHLVKIRNVVAAEAVADGWGQALDVSLLTRKGAGTRTARPLACMGK
jgi:HTH-type transcriptional regulator / antitoxin HigA